jgi:hypothetical protein
MESIVTGDDTCVCEFTLESGNNSMAWKHLHSLTTKIKN